ncbi:MAG: hypothetical protein GXP44_01105 [bacterium]|nr:hypothetical protein [bacterium]
MEIEIKKMPGCEVEITGEISAGDFEANREPALEKLSEGVKIDGFRPGKVPAKVLAEKIGEGAVLEEMAELSLKKIYPEIIKENKIEAIGRPEITITKIAPNNPLGFKIKTAVMPEIKLADYKAIAPEINAKKEEISVSEKDIEQVIEQIRKSRAVPKNKGGEPAPAGQEAAEPELPELTDEFVKAVGNFESVEDFKKKIGENILLDKKAKAKEKKRVEILDKIIEGSEIEAPRVLIEAEKRKMLEEMKASISQMGLKWEDYLKHLKKTEDEIVKGWDKDASKRVKQGLVLNEIAIKEKIEVPEDELNKEIDKIIDYYKTANQDIDRGRVREYTYGMMRNERAFRKLGS